MNFHIERRTVTIGALLALVLIVAGPFGCSSAPPPVAESPEKTDPKVAEAEGMRGHRLEGEAAPKHRERTPEEKMGL